MFDLLWGLPRFAAAPLYRRWHVRWGATSDEVSAPMAGDEDVRDASLNATRAITIAAPPERVWPWIVQMGYRRAGVYTYDIVDNAGYESADCVLDEYQKFAIGDWAFPMNGLFGLTLPVNDTTAFKVKSFETNSWLLWEKPDSTWSWLLTPLSDGTTRLVLRIKCHYTNLFSSGPFLRPFSTKGAMGELKCCASPLPCSSFSRGTFRRRTSFPRAVLTSEAGSSGRSVSRRIRRSTR
ncbi:MAG TPA: hypothetical protein VEU77_00520 [Candidatus Acidoferrales bacterium]|nr:hypothetical protein [Candidatus Acidoferrales bacterium]